MSLKHVIKIFVLTLFCTLAATLIAGAQNNPFEIDDECFKYYQEAERVAGQAGFFEKASGNLLKTAIEKKDTKAQTLYYVCRLKHVRALIQDRGNITSDDDKKVLESMEELKKMAKSLGYMQYYYYAYEVAQTYFYNQGKMEQTLELIHQMREDAIENHDDYGIWLGDCYIVQIYISENDHISAKKYILDALETYNTSTDPLIRRQSPTRLYCDLADTYPIGHDSVRINISKACDNRKQHLDTLRCEYNLAKLAAFDKDIPAYEKARDYCLSDKVFLNKISSSAEHLFQVIDTLVYHVTPNPNVIVTDMRHKLREVKYVANIAEVYGYTDLAFDLEKRLVNFHEERIAKADQSRLAEFDARLGNDLLSAQVDAEANRAQHARQLAMLLAILVMAGVLTFTIIHIRALQKSNKKIRLADESKTRFVQNMSHEVRTPLNAIVGFSQLLSLPDGTFPEEEKAEFASHIVNNTKMLTMLLDDILSVSAMNSGGYRITYEQGEKDYMAQAAISSSEHRLQPGVRMYYEPEEKQPFTFTTDPNRVQQILINLLTNACKHTQKGEIKLTSSLTARPGFVTYACTDTGSGVPADQAEAIFQRFTKLNDFVQGTGLGLSICREIATKMGAKVYLDTTYTDGGARFIFEVPLEPPKADNK